MRLWSIHPKYLDPKGLTALWREALLAKKVLQGKTKGYKNHPQLIRFRHSKDCIKSINTYLYHIFRESCSRGYCFDQSRIGRMLTKKKIDVSSGQISYEFRHLLNKLRKRDIKRYSMIRSIKKPEPNPLFRETEGSVEAWEKT